MINSTSLNEAHYSPPYQWKQTIPLPQDTAMDNKTKTHKSNGYALLFWEMMQYADNLTQFTRLCVTSHSQPLINAQYQNGK
jgi:hypothetical protein